MIHIKYYTSDLHIGHKGIIDMDGRPFESTEEMTEVIVSRWNEVVTRRDDVYVLGDMFWNNSVIDEVFPRLKGNIFLIKGNHDRTNRAMKARIKWCKDYAEIQDMVKGVHKNVVLCHYPIAHWNGADYGSIHLYGHIHSTGRDCRPFAEYVNLMKQRGLPYECYNVGCMLHDYRPVTLDQIINGGI